MSDWSSDRYRVTTGFKNAVFSLKSYLTVWYQNEKAFGMYSQWHYTNYALTYGYLTSGLWSLCHVRIRQSPSMFNAILNTYQMPSRYYPRPVLAFGYCHRLCLWVCVSVCLCVCVCVCINHELVRTITHRPFKLGSPSLDQRCKIPWFRSLLFVGMIDLDLQYQI